jgi:hypothetical protein
MLPNWRLQRAGAPVWCSVAASDPAVVQVLCGRREPDARR